MYTYKDPPRHRKNTSALRINNLSWGGIMIFGFILRSTNHYTNGPIRYNQKSHLRDKMDRKDTSDIVFGQIT